MYRKITTTYNPWRERVDLIKDLIWSQSSKIFWIWLGFGFETIVIGFERKIWIWFWIFNSYADDIIHSKLQNIIKQNRGRRENWSGKWSMKPRGAVGREIHLSGNDGRESRRKNDIFGDAALFIRSTLVWSFIPCVKSKLGAKLYSEALRIIRMGRTRSIWTAYQKG